MAPALGADGAGAEGAEIVADIYLIYMLINNLKKNRKIKNFLL